MKEYSVKSIHNKADSEIIAIVPEDASETMIREIVDQYEDHKAEHVDFEVRSVNLFRMSTGRETELENALSDALTRFSQVIHDNVEPAIEAIQEIVDDYEEKGLGHALERLDAAVSDEYIMEDIANARDVLKKGEEQGLQTLQGKTDHFSDGMEM